MTDDSILGVAVLTAAAAVYLAVPGLRVRLSAGSRGVNATWSRLVALVAPLQGAPSTFVRASAGLIAGCLALGLAGSTEPAALGLAVVVGLAGFVGLGRWRPAAVRGRDQALTAALPGLCTLLAVCLEAGLPLRNAVAAVAPTAGGPIGPVLRRLATSVVLGVPEEQAWRELGEVEPALRNIAREVSHATDRGVAVAPVLRNHAIEARRVAHGTAQARARKVGVSSVVPLMVCFLPAFILVGVVPIVGGVVLSMWG